MGIEYIMRVSQQVKDVTQVIDKKGQFMVNNKRLVSDSSTLKQITIHTDTTIGQRRNKNSTHEHVSRAVKQNKIETT
jgi:hypothetical protein